MIADNLTIAADVNHIERVQAVLVINVDTVNAILQNEDHAGRGIFRGRCNRMQAKRCFINIRMLLCVLDQIQPELV